jgi:spore coat-associated protein N
VSPIPLLGASIPVSRLSALAAHPRRTVGALAVVLAAVGITVGSGANFTASAANPSNTFTAGTLSIGTSSSSALFNATNLKPGDTVPGTVDIQNTGSLPGTFTLSTSHVTDTSALLGQLDLKIEDCGVWSGSSAPPCGGTNIVYDAKANPVGTVNLGTFASNAKHRYRFDVTMPSSIANSFQGTTASVQFDWNAAS